MKGLELRTTKSSLGNENGESWQCSTCTLTSRCTSDTWGYKYGNNLTRRSIPPFRGHFKSPFSIAINKGWSWCVNQSRQRDVPMHSTSIQNCSGILNAYVADTVTFGGQPIQAQTSLVPIHRPRRHGGLARPRRMSGIRTRDHACNALLKTTLPPPFLRSGKETICLARYLFRRSQFASFRKMVEPSLYPVASRSSLPSFGISFSEIARHFVISRLLSLLSRNNCQRLVMLQNPQKHQKNVCPTKCNHDFF